MSSGKIGAYASLDWQLAVRFLRGRRSRLVDGTARAALAATAIGVMAMVVAMALMSGYREDLQQKLVAGNAAVIIYPLVAAEESGALPPLAERIAEIPGIVEVRRVGYGQGSLSVGSSAAGIEVTLRGVDTAAERSGLGSVELYGETDAAAPLASGDVAGVLLGRELAERLGPGEGALRLMVLGFVDGRPRFRYRSVRPVGTFHTGFSEFDRSWVVVDRRLLEGLTGGEVGSGLYELVLEDLHDAEPVAEQVRALIGPDYLVSDWQDLNRELFTALRVQQMALFLVLGLIVLVSTFNVASTLVVLVRERMREIGVLTALGLSAARLRRVFFIYGSVLSVTGILAGVLAGWCLSWVLTEFELIRFSADVAAIYFISSVPFHVRPGDLLAVVGFTLVVTLLACWLPARRAGDVRPAVALRYE